MITLNRVGKINYNLHNDKMTIIEYNNYNDIVVEFEDGSKIKSRYGHFKDRCIKNPYSKTIYNKGFIGEGNYIAGTIQYNYWRHMLKRCYDEQYQQKYPTYKGANCCEEWHNFQNFGKWFDENYYEIEGERTELDKDVLYKGNKIYSPETCVYIPRRINSLFVKSDALRGEYPIGVTYNKKNDNFVSRCNTLNGRKHLGCFDTPIKAFNIYKEFKEEYIKQVADEYKNKIPKQLYDAMYKYKVEITD